MSDLKKYIIPIIFLLTFLNGKAQPSWYFTNTGSNHTILVQDTINISIEGIQISIGDYIGVFYDSLGNEACAGYLNWQGISTTIAVWGSQSGLHDGFASGEQINWKVWRASDQHEFDAIATYDTIMFPHQGNYSTNGLSRLASLNAILSGGSGPPWNYAITSNTHHIIIPDTLLIAPNFNLNYGDYIGVFYDAGGTLECGGYIEWTGVTDTLIAYGQTPGQNNGFAPGESFSFKLWNTDIEIPIAPWTIEYDIINYPDSSWFFSYGISYISKIGQFTGPDLQVNNLVFPQSGCELSYQNILPIIEITNVGDQPISEVSGYISFANLNDDYFTITGLNILPDSSAQIEIQYYLDITALGEYNIEIWAISQNDLNYTNSIIHQTITNSLYHEVSFISQDTTLCSSNQASINLEGFPDGGTFIGQNIFGNDFLAFQSGVFPIIYEQLNSETGCSNSDTIIITVLESPFLNLGNDTTLCDGDTLNLIATPNLSLYNWSGSSNSSNILEVTSENIYSLTVTDSQNCQSIDDIEILYNQNPVVSISGYAAACEGETITLDAGSGFDFYQWEDSVTVFSQTHAVSETGTYTVTVTNDNCSSSDDFYVEFYPLPFIEISGDESACVGETIKLEATEGFQYYLWSTTIGNSSSINVTQSGLYSVSVISTNNCLGSDEIEVIFNSYPEIQFNNPPILCNGDTFNIYPGSADSYIWQDNSTLSYFPATTDGEYSVRMISSGCTSEDEISLIFFNKPEANFSFSTDFNEIELYNESQIADNYYWDFGDGSVSGLFEPIHIYNIPGIYEIKLAAENYCGSTNKVDTVEIKNISFAGPFQYPVIYPNPGNGNFYIDVPVLESSNFTLSIINSEGKEIISDQEINLERGEHILHLNIEFVDQGIYYAIWRYKSEIFKNTLIIINSTE